MAEPAAVAKMEKIVALCKRRGFIFQSSEIYGGLNGAWDYGPLGVELKRNLKDYWWKCMTQLRDDIVGFDGSILMNAAVWKASGHVDTFSDPLVECMLTKKRYRADQIEPQSGTAYYYKGIRDKTAQHLEHRRLAQEHGQLSGEQFAEVQERIEAPFIELPFSVLVTKGKDWHYAQHCAEMYYDQMRKFEDYDLISADPKTEQVQNSTAFNPENGAQLSEPRTFNLMFQTYVGPVQDASSITYLRPETAQAMFVQFKNVLEVARKKLPFGIAQIGKAFRNEINPRNFTFRSREFEQMEVEFFVKPGTGFEWLDKWLGERLAWYEAIGIPRAKIHVLTVPDADRAFYSKGTYDLEYEFPFGVQELEGIAYRTDYDLSQHQKASGKPLEYFDEETKTRYIPHVVEPSAGVDRTVLALLCEAYAEETVKDEESGKEETRVVLRFVPRLAPVKAGVFPLLKNKPELVAVARNIQKALQPLMKIAYDEAGSIGKRYRRIDEEGTPFGITVDFETLEGVKEASTSASGSPISIGQKETVTLRHRDSMKQERIAIGDLPAYLLAKIG
ncbi:MAG TPA: glycine--tRNA ligase [Candidatus Methylacidiphilales bacterium]|jgi:glycyl-tRNA synthetase|nr:glycine--tRNA ligase [Candidatus Methylacidiphilales bacterium]